MYTKQVIIYDGKGWKVTSFGNGAAYSLEADGKFVFLQGEDAGIFREELDKYENAGLDPDKLLADYYGAMSGDGKEF